MASDSFAQSCGPILIILVIFHTTNISALQCYGCLMGAQVSPELNPKKECLWDTPPDQLLVSNYSSIPFIQVAVEGLRKNMSSLVTMVTGPFCVKMWTEHNGQRSVIRYIMPEGPAASFLDPSGCTTGNKVHMCFCRRDKCNNDGPQNASKVKANPIESMRTASSSEIHLISPAYVLLIFALAMLTGHLVMAGCLQ